jgi:hypothetical protein
VTTKQAGPPAVQGLPAFAGVTMLVVGVFQAVEGLVALLRSTYYVVGANQLVVQVGYPVWGWVHLVLGALLVVVGIGVLGDNRWARIAGIVLAALSAVVNLAFVGAYPVWAVVVIAIDIVIIYALTTAGRRTAS